MKSWLPSPRKAVATLAAAIALWAGGPAQAGTWQPSEDDSLIFELRSSGYRIGDTLRGYQTPAGVCLDMADLIQTLDLPVRLDKKSRRATGWIFAEDQRFALDRDSYTVQTVNGQAPLAANAIYDTPEGWCADLGALSTWFGVRLRADMGNLAIFLETDRKLPFIEAMARRSRAARLRSTPDTFDLAQLPQAEVPYRSWRTPSVDLMLRTQWKSTLNSGRGPDVQYEALASGEALGASFEARLASDRSGVPAALRLRAYRNDPAGGLLGSLHATQLAAGDVETQQGALTGQSAVGRGFFISNRPLSRPGQFGKTTIRGDLPAGWDAELYRNGSLRAFQADRGDGRYEFDDVELLYGLNEFEVVLYGPQGQLRRERTSMPVGIESIPAGKTWYWAGIVDDGHELFDFSRTMADPLTGWRWGVGVERGIDKKTSAGLEMQSLVMAGKRHDYLEATLRRAVGPALVDISGAQQFGAGAALRAQALGKIGKWRFQAQTMWIDGGFESELVKAEELRHHSLRIDGEAKFGRVTIPLQAAIERSRTRDGASVTEWLMRASLNLRHAALSVQLSQRSTRGGQARDAAADGTRLELLGNTMLGPVRLRGETRFRISGEKRGFEAAALYAEANLSERTNFRATIEHDAQNERTDFGLGLIQQFKRFSLRADASADTRGAIGFGLSLAMSLGPDPVDGGWRVSRDRLAQQGQASVEVFRDDNGDGYRQPGEEAVEGVMIEAGFHHSEAPTNKQGRAVVDGLRPFVPVLVGIDTGSLPDPLLQPKGRGMVVVPRPGVAAKLSLPLAPTGEAEAILLGTDGEAVAGVTLELVDGAGRVAAQAVSEFDGYVLFDLVPYGDYRLRIGAASAAILGVKPELGAMVRFDKGHTSLRLGNLRLEKAMPLHVAAAP